MKKTLKRIFAGVLVITLLISMSGANALAGQPRVKTQDDEEEGELNLVELKIKKVLNLPEAGVRTPGEDFKFRFEKYSKDGKTKGEYGADFETDMPAIPDVTINYSYADVTDADNNKPGKQVEKASNNILTNVLFTETGQYTYKVTEIAPDQLTPPEELTPGMTYSEEEYLVSIFAEKDEQGTTVVKSVFIKGKEGVKVAGTDFTFTNNYNKQGSFELEKEVVDNSDTGVTNKYPFTFTVTKPKSNTQEDPSFKYKISPNGAERNAEYGVAVNVELKHGEKVVFTDVLLGSKVQAEETNSFGFTQGIKTGSKLNGKSVGDVEALTTGMVVGDADKETFDILDNRVVYQNTQQTPTGVLIDNLPFIALALAAGIGIFFFVKNSRKNEEFEV